MVRVTPRGGADRVEGVGRDGELLIRVRAVPADGAANKQMLELLASELSVPPSALRIESGARARLKRVSVVGTSAGLLRTRWPALAVSDS